MGSEQHYSLRWNDYTVKIVTAFQSLRDEEDFVDVTVACDGHSYSAHKMVLSACSPYFRSLLRANPCQHPIVILKDVGHVELERLLEFMYNGEVSIAQDQLAAFLKTAENLKIRGLAGSSDEMDQAGVHRPDVSYSYSSSSAPGGGVTSDRSSPSAGYAPSQSSKDDELVGEGYHTRPNSPPAKRRKRSSAPAASSAAGHADSTPASHTTEGVTGDSSVEVDSGGTLGGGGLSGDDDGRLDRREMKSEPAMPGPSGAAGQEGGSSHEPGDGGGGLKEEESGEVLDLWLGEVDNAIGGEEEEEVEMLKQSPPPPPTPQQPPPPPPSSVPPPPPPPPEHQHHHQHQLPQPQQPHHHLHHHHAPPPQHPSLDMGDDSTWTPFPAHPNAPLTHLETLTHSTFMQKSEIPGDMGATGVPSDDMPVEAVIPPPTPWFPCPQCGKSFRTRITLTRHEKIHKGNAFPCPLCPKVFYQVSNVKYHVHAVHGRQYESPVRGSHDSLSPLT